MTKSSNLDDRARQLQELLEGDGIEVSLEDARDLLIADVLEQLK